LGAAIRSSGFLADGQKYCHNGGMAFAHHHDARLRQGVHEDDRGPFGGPYKNNRFAGKRPGGPPSTPFGGSDGSSAFWQTARSTATTGTWASPTTHGGLPSGGYARNGRGGRRDGLLDGWTPVG
jgi:hypothetical protein